MYGVRYCKGCDLELPVGCQDALCTNCFHASLQTQAAGIGEVETDTDLPMAGRMTDFFEIDPYDPLMPTKDQRFGDYELLEQVAQGGMGLVFRARQVSLNRIVALKVIRAGQLASPSDVQRFRIEAEAAAHLDHPRIVPIYEIGELRGIHYFSMKLVEGGNLAVHMQRYVKDPRAGARLLAGAGRGVHYAHQRGVLHRDLKPANILVDEDGRPHVTDFGVAKRVGVANVECADALKDASISGTLSGGIVGTPSYMAPEQAAGLRDGLTVAVDIYSLGAILFEILTGRPPFKALSQMATLRQVVEESPPTPRSLNPKVDRTLEAICLKCLARKPYDRYHSAEDLVNDLERWLAHEPIEMQRGKPWLRTVKWMKRRPATAGLTALTFLVFCIGVGASIWQHEQVSAQELRLQRTQQAEQSERQKADAALEQLRIKQYADQLEAAQRFWEANDRGAMTTALNACPDDLRGWEWRYLKDLAGDHSLNVSSPLSHTSQLTFSLDGRRLILANDQGQLALVEVETGRTLHEWDSRQGAVKLLAVTANRDRLATAGMDNSVAVWNARTGERLLTFVGYPQGVRALAFSPRGSQLAVAAAQSTGEGACHVLHVWDLNHLGEPVAITLGTEAATALAFSPDGQTLAASGKNELRLWDLREPTRLPRLLHGVQEATCLAFASDGQTLAAGSQGKAVRWWKLGSTLGDAAVNVEGCADSPSQVWFSPDGSSVSANVAGEVILWNSITGREMARSGKPTNGNHASAASSNGQWLASLSASGQLSLRSLMRPEYQVVLRGLGTGRVQPVLSGDGRKLVVLNEQASVHIYNPHTYKSLVRLVGHEAPVIAAAFSGDGKAVYTLDRAGTLKGWDAGLGEPIFSISTGLNEASCLAAAVQGNAVAVSGPSGKVQLWNPVSRRKLFDFEAHSAAIHRLAFSPDGRMLGAASDDHTARLWDATTGVELLALRGHQAPVLDLAFRRDGNQLVTVSADQTARLWDLGSGQETHTLRGHTGPVTSLALHPKEQRIVTTSADHTLRIWDGMRGLEVFSLRVGDSVHGVEFTPDGQRLLGGGIAGRVRQWQSEQSPTREREAKSSPIADASGSDAQVN